MKPSLNPGHTSTTGTHDYVRGPDLWKGSDKDSGITVTFDFKINAGTNERLGFGVWDWTVGSGYFYTLNCVYQLETTILIGTPSPMMHPH